MSDYHLIFDLNGVLVAMGEGETRIFLVVLKLGLKVFLFACVNFFTMYIWSLAMKKNFSRHLEIITEKTGVYLSSFKIVDKSLYLKNENFLLEKPNKPIFHKTFLIFLFDFLVWCLRITCWWIMCFTRVCLILLLMPSFLKHFTKHIVMLITCSKLFFLGIFAFV